MLFHIVVIKIGWEFAEIEFDKKNFQIFHFWAAFLTKYFTHTVECLLWQPNLGQIWFFAKSCKFVKMALNTKVIYETLVNSMVLYKISL